MNDLENKTIKAVRIKGISDIMDFDIDAAKGNDIRNAFKCVRNANL